MYMEFLNLALHVLQDLVLENLHFYHFLQTKAWSPAEPKNRQYANCLSANSVSTESAAAFACLVVFTFTIYNRHR